MPLDYSGAIAAGYTPQEIYQHAIASGYTPQQIETALRGAQFSGPLRLPAMLGSAAVEGLDQTLGLPGEAVNLATNALGLGRPFATGQTFERLTNEAGLTNNLALTPGAGEFPEAERLVAGAGRGVGGALPFLLGGPLGGIPAALTLGSGAASGAVGEAAHEMAPNSTLLPAIAGGAAGILAGGIGAGLRPGPAPAAQVLDDTVSQLGGFPGTTYMTVGQQIKQKLAAIDHLRSLGQAAAPALPQKTLTSYLRMQPSKLTERLFSEPENLQILNPLMPDEMSLLGAARLNRFGIAGWQGSKLQPEVKDVIVPDQGLQDRLDELANRPPAPKANVVHSVSEPLIAGTLGAMGGAGLAHIGVLPGGEMFAGELGSLVGMGGDAVRRVIAHHAAKSLLEPWIYGMGAEGAATGNAGGQPEGFAP